MIAITSISIPHFGLELPEACVEVKDLNTAKEKYYQAVEGETPVMKNTIVNCKVWTNEQAYLDGKQPITEIQRIVDLPESIQNENFNNALDAAFPEAIIK